MASVSKKWKLGHKVRDAVTGFVGIATSKIEFLNGCVQVCITGRANDEKEGREIQIDTDQVSYVGPGVIKEKEPTKRKKPIGGPSVQRITTRKI